MARRRVQSASLIPLNFQDSSAEVIARIYFWRLDATVPPARMKIVSDRDPRFQDAMWKEHNCWNWHCDISLLLAIAAPGRRKIVGTSTLRSKPTSTVEAPTTFDYFNDPAILHTTPVEEGREEEYLDQLAYAFQYGSDLPTFLKSTGLKMATGYTFDNTTADVDFHSLLAGLGHVMYPVSYHEAAKLLDLEHDYDFITSPSMSCYVVFSHIHFVGTL
ncbi:hypothetical protein CYMTET_38208 [Cymbomonas tetramitiformis]|uniref:Uncharacterized protein n=1 Tax=Cymbomonas tetramitiformis TaxID=36881 RepID=A0AAE0CCI0_9CHLO|nr:hypothetical protein CYMTET_38208 [Cymbomonas tetramitiformis]